MKKIFYVLIPVLFALVASSCDRDYDDNYMGNADERLTAAMNKYQRALASAQNGWIANVWTNDGIYRFYMSFTTDNRVTMVSDNMNYNGFDNKAQTTSYRFKALQRPTLIFDTYSYLSVICDPDNSVSWGSDNQGLETDFEFEVAAFEHGQFELVGRTHRTRATLVPATEEEEDTALNPATGMIGQFATLQQYFAQGFPYIGTDFGQTELNIGYRYMYAAYLVDGEPVQTETVYTIVDFNQDILLEEPLAIGDIEISRLTWEPAQKAYIAELTDGGELPVKLAPDHIIPLYRYLGAEEGKIYNVLFVNMAMVSGEYAFYESSNPLTSAIIAYDRDLGRIRSSLRQLAWIFRTDKDDPTHKYVEMQVMFTQTRDDGDATFAIYYNYDITEIAPGEIKLSKLIFPYDEYENNSYLYENGIGKAFLDALANKTFKMEWGEQVTFGRNILTPGVMQCVENPKLRFVAPMDNVR